MPVKSEKDLPQNQRAAWLKAMSAMELRNYGYAIQLLQSIMRSHPDFLLARQLARKAAVGEIWRKERCSGQPFQRVLFLHAASESVEKRIR